MVSGIMSGSRKKVGVPASSEEDCNKSSPFKKAKKTGLDQTFKH